MSGLKHEHKGFIFQAHQNLFALSISSDFRDEEVKEKCKEMADYLRGKLYDPLLGAPPKVRAKHRNSAV